MDFKKKLLIILIAISTFNINAEWYQKLKVFNLPKGQIDVVIACHEKDKYTLEYCITNVKKFVKNLRRIIVVSGNHLTNNAEWFDESLFPFSKKLIEQEFALMDPDFYNDPVKIQRVGWYFKQILNFYAAFVIPNISSNILILDADVLFAKSIEFTDSKGTMLHAPGTEHVDFYFEHMSRLLPGLKKVIPNYSGISHHMLFQRPILKDLFSLVESYHKMEFWRAYCRCISPNAFGSSGSADYEIYFNFVLMRTKQIKIRILKWENIESISKFNTFQEGGYDFVSCHSWARNKEEIALEKLVFSGNDLNTIDIDGNTPLMLATKYNNSLLVKKILDFYDKKTKFDLLNSKNNDGLSAIFLAIKYNSLNSLKEILNDLTNNIPLELKQQILNTKNKDGLPIYHLAMRYEAQDAFSELIKHGADLCLAESNGNTLIHYVVMYNVPIVLEKIQAALSKKKFNMIINLKNNDGLTPLHLAIRNNQYIYTQKLIKLGVNKKALNNQNQTPHEYAKSFKNTRLKFMELLK